MNVPDPASLPRDTSGRFRPGRSGNPRGRQARPPGLAERLAGMARDAAEAAMLAVVERAKAGDPDAARLVVELAGAAR